LWLLKADPSGTLLWETFVKRGVESAGMGLVQIAAGEYAVVALTGSFDTGEVDGWLLRFGDPTLALMPTQSTPSQFALHAAFPNPFNPATTVRFDLPIRADFSLIIYDLTGRQVNILKQGNLEAGHYRVSWPGLDQSGRQMPSGIYIARLQSAQYAKSIKMILLK
jgi:hypothetical protein